LKIEALPVLFMHQIEAVLIILQKNIFLQCAVLKIEKSLRYSSPLAGTDSVVQRVNNQVQANIYGL